MLYVNLLMYTLIVEEGVFVGNNYRAFEVRCNYAAVNFIAVINRNFIIIQIC